MWLWITGNAKHRNSGMKKEYIQNIISKQRKINRPFRPDRPIHAKENVSGPAECGNIVSPRIWQTTNPTLKFPKIVSKRPDFLQQKCFICFFSQFHVKLFLSLFTASQRYLLLFFAVYFLFFRLYGKFFCSVKYSV